MTDKKPQNAGRRPEGGERPPRRRAPPRAKAEPEAQKAFEGDRIAKVMARAGACSRRDAEAWIAEGRVSVNGTVLTSPAFNVREGDRIEIDGEPLAEREPTRLFLFHKPEGLVTSAKDPEGRDTVFGFLAERYPDLPRLVSVGRLDINTEGLLLLTNDGGLARTLELPATGWTRRYRVRAHGEIDQAQLDALKKGVTVDDVDYAPIEARLDRVQGANAWISMSLREGKNREIKRVLEHLGLDVNRLIRISFGPFQLGELAEGAVEEVKLKTLREQLGKGLAELAGVDFSSPRRDTAEPEHVIEEERRQRAKTRTRKHVSALRAEVEESRGKKAPRARVERSATSDRKGRAVAVETIKPVRRREQEEERPATRNARRFQAERQEQAPRGRRAEGAERREPRAERDAPLRRRFGEDREAPRRADGEAAPVRRREAAARPRTEERRGPRFEGRGDAGARQETRPRRPRPEGEASARPHRGERPSGPRTEGRGGFERRGRDDFRKDGERAERPRRPRPEGEAPARPHRGERPSGPRTEGSGGFERRGRDDFRKDGERAERPRRPRPEGEAPARPHRGERPSGPRTEGRGGFERRGRDDFRKDGERAERPRRPRPEGEAPARSFAKPRRDDRKAAAPRSGERDGYERRERSGPPREQRAEAPRKPRPPRDGKPAGGKFGGDTFGSGKPSGGRPSGGKPAGGRPSGGRPSGGKPSGSKPSGGKPGGPRKPPRERR